MKYILIVLLFAFIPSGIISADDSTFCSCVRTAQYLGAKLPMVDAQYFQQFKRTMPTLNGLVLLQYGKVSHVAVIKGFKENGIVVSEGNYKKCAITTRIIDYNNPNIRGFWSTT